MTLHEMLRVYGSVTLDLPDVRGPMRVTAGTEKFDMELEDIHFATGGGVTLVHPVAKELAAKAWAGAPDACEACQ